MSDKIRRTMKMKFNSRLVYDLSSAKITAEYLKNLQKHPEVNIELDDDDENMVMTLVATGNVSDVNKIIKNDFTRAQKIVQKTFTKSMAGLFKYEILADEIIIGD